MSETEHPNQPRTIGRRRRRLHWTAVAGLWLIAAAWIAVDPLTGNHSDVTSRWMDNVSVLLTAMAATTLIGYLIQVLTIEPSNTSDRKFELGYAAGRYDERHEGRPALGLVTDLRTARGPHDGQTGT